MRTMKVISFPIFGLSTYQLHKRRGAMDCAFWLVKFKYILYTQLFKQVQLSVRLVVRKNQANLEPSASTSDTSLVLMTTLVTA